MRLVVATTSGWSMDSSLAAEECMLRNVPIYIHARNEQTIHFPATSFSAIALQMYAAGPHCFVHRQHLFETNEYGKRYGRIPGKRRHDNALD